MLTSLHVKNFAIIAEIKADLSEGFSVFTGETGAGKSLLIDALQQLLGARSNKSIVGRHDTKTIIEATFDVSKLPLKAWFEEKDLPYFDQLIVRREISASGRSRAFINDAVVTLDTISEISSHLVDIHQQHDSVVLNTDHFRINLIDSFAGCVEKTRLFSKTYDAFIAAQQQLDKLKNERQQAIKERDYNAFLLKELQEFPIEQIEIEALETELNVMEHAEEIKRELHASIAILSEDEQNALAAVQHTLQRLASLRNKHSESSALHDRLQSVHIELNDIVQTMEQIAEGTDYDPKQVDAIRTKYDAVVRLLQKHTVATTEELLHIQQGLESNLANTEALDTKIEKAKNEIAQLDLDLKKQGKALHKERAAVAPKFAAHILGSLQKLGMPNAQFDVSISSTEKPNHLGFDQIQFLFNANKGQELKPLHQTASGGELSRVMLAIRGTLASTSNLPTMIFDEIDTGVSGDIADKMGSIMYELGKEHQVFSITHLPQVAANGSAHYKIFKSELDGITTTQLKALSASERIDEIAVMLSGEKVTKQAVDNAKALLG